MKAITLTLGLLLHISLGSGALAVDSTRADDWAPTPSNLPRQFARDFVDTAVDFGAYMVSPVSWDKQDWGTFLVVTGITGGLLLVDGAVHSAFDPEKTKWAYDALKPVQLLGDFRVLGLPLPFLYLGSFFVHDKKLQRATKIAVRSLLFQALINQFLKNATFRTNFEDPWDFHWGPPEWTVPSNGAFPSGHASNIWAVMSAFAIVYEDDPVIPWICYGLALGNNLAQVLYREHWVSDLFFGAALGYFSSTFLASRDEQRGFALQVSSQGLAFGYRMQF